jgi:hypothetical protein
MSKRQQFPQSQYTAPAPTPTQRLRLIAALTPAQPHIIYLRDGEVVVYRRTRSLLYQCRYKRADGARVRQTTGIPPTLDTSTPGCVVFQCRPNRYMDIADHYQDTACRAQRFMRHERLMKLIVRTAKKF